MSNHYIVILRLFIWLNLPAGKMKRILRSDWLLKRARWAIPVPSGLPALVLQEKFSCWPCKKSLIDQACSVKMVLIKFGPVLFCGFIIDLDFQPS